MTVQLPQSGDPFLSGFSVNNPAACSADRIETLKFMAAELFPGDVTVQLEDDPEIAGRQYLVVSVSAQGEVQEIVSRRREWYHRTAQLLGDDCDKVRLSISVAE